MKSGLILLLSLLVYSLYGCGTKPDTPVDVKERAANATAELKQDTKAVAEGIREGWTRDKSLDINAATKEQLESLPGVTSKQAGNIVSHRPYAKTSELVEKHILSKAEYDKVADRIAVK
jgi:DNA uptake protein ComE-like DNA-binding protein